MACTAARCALTCRQPETTWEMMTEGKLALGLDARLADVRRNRFHAVRYVESRAIGVVLRAQRNNVPRPIRTSAYLHVRADQAG